MIQAGIGYSTQAHTARAALEAGRAVIDGLDGRNPDWAIVFATAEHADRASALVAAVTGVVGTPYVVGCSASGILAGGTEIERGPALAVLGVVSDQVRATPFLFHDEGDAGMTAGVRMAQRLSGSRNSQDLLLVWPDPFHVRPDRLLESIEAVLGPVTVVGGAASGGAQAGATRQFCGNDHGSACVSGVRLGGRFRRMIGVTQGCRPLGPPLRVTGAHENLLLEVDGRPALEVLRERSPDDLLDDLGSAFHFLFVGLLPDAGGDPAAHGEYLVRNIITADPDTGVLAIAEPLEEGQRLLFVHREPQAARADLLRMLEHVAPRRTGLDYRFGLYFNCLARGESLYRERGVDSALIGEALPGVPLLGFFCNAEIGPLRGVNQLFTYTGVLLLVAD